MIRDEARRIALPLRFLLLQFLLLLPQRPLRRLQRQRFRSE